MSLWTYFTAITTTLELDLDTICHVKAFKRLTENLQEQFRQLMRRFRTIDEVFLKKLFCEEIKSVGWKYYIYIPQESGHQAPPGSITRTRLLVVSLYVILNYSIDEMHKKFLQYTSAHSDLVRSVCCLLNPTNREMLMFYANNASSLVFLEEKYLLLCGFMESKFRTGKFCLKSSALITVTSCRLTMI